MNRTVCQELKNHQEKIAQTAINAMPGKKIQGQYIYTWYTYPTIKVDFNSREYYSWVNFTPSSILTKYEDALITGFRWTPTNDDILIR